MPKKLKTYFITGTCYRQNNIKVEHSALIKANNVFTAEKQFKNDTIIDGYRDPYTQDIKVIE